MGARKVKPSNKRKAEAAASKVLRSSKSKSVLIERFGGMDIQESRVNNKTWNVARLVTLARHLDVFDLPLNHLNIDYWYGEMNLRQLTGHIKSVNDADLSFPIILDEDGVIMDGRHRVMKALVSGERTIKAVRFDKTPDPCREEV